MWVRLNDDDEATATERTCTADGYSRNPPQTFSAGNCELQEEICESLTQCGTGSHLFLSLVIQYFTCCLTTIYQIN